MNIINASVLHRLKCGFLLSSMAVFGLVAGCATMGFETRNAFDKDFDEKMASDGFPKTISWAKHQRENHLLPEEAKSDAWKDSTWDDTQFYFHITIKMIDSYFQYQGDPDCNAVTEEYRGAVDAIDKIWYRFNRAWINSGFRYRAKEIAACIYAGKSDDRLKLMSRVYLSTIRSGQYDDSLYQDGSSSRSLIALMKENGDAKSARQIAAYEAVVRPKQMEMSSKFKEAVNNQFNGVDDSWGQTSVIQSGNANIFSQIADGLKSAGYGFYLEPYAEEVEVLRYKSEKSAKYSEESRKSKETTNMINGILLSASAQINAANVARPQLAGTAGQWQTMSNNLNGIMLQTLTEQHNQKMAAQAQAPVADLLRKALKEYEAKN